MSVNQDKPDYTRRPRHSASPDTNSPATSRTHAKSRSPTRDSHIRPARSRSRSPLRKDRFKPISSCNAADKDEAEERGRKRDKIIPTTDTDCIITKKSTKDESTTEEITTKDEGDIPIQENDDSDIANMDISALMGFGSFGTTKHKKVGPDVGAVAVKKPSKFRQYMNRDGGFNRSLSPS